jgi:hypothetical protein
MTPVAPPPIQEAAPIAPPDVNAPAPVADPSFVSPVRAPEADLNSMYEDAASNGDPVSMYSLSSRLKGTPMEAPVKRIATTMQNNLSAFEKEVRPVMEAGGANTPEGRLAASKAFENIGDKPQKMRAFVEMLMGNPKWRTFVTGGTPTTSIAYDKQGNQLEKTVNELGQIISVTDTMGRKLTRDELTERGGFVTSLQEALGYQQEKDQLKFNTEKLNAANAATGEYAAKAPEQKRLYQEMQQRLQNLWGSGLSEEQRKTIGLFTSRTAGLSQSMSEGFNALNQYVDNKNVSLSAAQQKALSSAMEALGFKMGADGSITNKKGEAVTKTELDQAQKSFSNSQNFEKNFNQTKADFLQNEVIKNMGSAEIKNLGRILDLQGQLEKTQLELVAKHGTLPFVINPKSYEIGDEFSRGIASSLIGEFNADATQMFAAWRDQQLSRYPKGSAPKPGELEAAFARTPQYQALREQFADRNVEVMKRTGEAAPKGQTNPANYEQTLGIQPETVKPEKPKSPKERSAVAKEDTGIPKGYVKIGKTKDGKDVYRTPEGKRVVEE